ncbi:MAG: proton-conducting transporter membrane subunit [Bryobacteraceae bacterium]
MRRKVVKAGIIPCHIRLPAAHPAAPSSISALMSGIMIKAGIYGMARVFFDFCGALPAWPGMPVLPVGIVSALPGVLYAVMEHDLKRLLAYHGIEKGIVSSRKEGNQGHQMEEAHSGKK